MKRIILAAILAIGLSSVAEAQAQTYCHPNCWPTFDSDRERRHYRQHRHRYYPQVRAWRQRYRPPVPAIPANHHAVCLHEVRALGTPHVTEDAARGAAQRHWQATVRYDHGEKYMNIETAQGVKWRCARAETNETTVGRVAETITGGEAWRMRCEVVARPCRVELQRTGQ